MVTLKKNKTKK